MWIPLLLRFLVSFLILDAVIRRSASIIIIHETYSYYRQTDDLALVELKEKLNFEEIHLNAICLPDQIENYPSTGTLTM